MKKLNALSKAEMKKVTGGVQGGSYCGEGSVLVRCVLSYDIVVNHPGGIWGPWGWESNPPTSETHTAVWGGCIRYEEYVANQANCTLDGVGGPYPLEP